MMGSWQVAVIGDGWNRNIRMPDGRRNVARFVLLLVAEITRQNAGKLAGPDRTRPAAPARQIAVYLLSVMFEFTNGEIATLLGRDRSTIAHACRVVEKRRDHPETERLVGAIEAILAPILPALIRECRR